MFAEPMLFVLSLGIKIIRLMIMMVIKICKYGFGWMLLGYVCDYMFLDERTGTAHVVFMMIAWGGTFLHFFGGKIIHAIKRHIKQAAEPEYEVCANLAQSKGEKEYYE